MTLPDDRVWIEGVIRRVARRAWRCTGDGADVEHRRYAPGHTDTIRPGDHCIEFVGETPAYHSGPRVCMWCALAFYTQSRKERFAGIEAPW